MPTASRKDAQIVQAIPKRVFLFFSERRGLAQIAEAEKLDAVVVLSFINAVAYLIIMERDLNANKLRFQVRFRLLVRAPRHVLTARRYCICVMGNASV